MTHDLENMDQFATGASVQEESVDFSKPVSQQVNRVLTEGEWSSEMVQEKYKQMRSGDWTAFAEIVREGYDTYSFTEGTENFEKAKDRGMRNWALRQLASMKNGTAVAAAHLKNDLAEKWQTEKNYLDIVSGEEFSDAEGTGMNVFVADSAKKAKAGDVLAYQDLLAFNTRWGEPDISDEQTAGDVARLLAGGDTIDGIRRAGVAAAAVSKKYLNSDIARKALIKHWKITDESELPTLDEIRNANQHENGEQILKNLKSALAV